MNINKQKKDSGFSLIEMVVVVGSFGIIIVAVISTILMTFKSQNMVKSNNKINENGRSILAELRRNVFNSDSGYITCGVGGSSVTVTNQKDRGVTTLVCRGNNIASNSAILNSGEVTAYDCQNFTTCNLKSGSSEVASVDFSFGLRTTTIGVATTQLFSTSITTRN